MERTTGSAWNDARLDELAREVDRLRPLGREIEHLSGKMSGLGVELGSTRTEVEGLRKDIRSFIGNPIAEKRQRNSAIYVSLLTAIGGGGFVYILSQLTGAPIH
jgi:hypothetical protein